jgi:hypothetical protein
VRFALGVAAIASVVACESLPALVFYADDAGVDASVRPSDAGVSGSGDGAPRDAKAILDTSLDESAPAIDSSADASNTCPAVAPPGDSICCDAIPCNGDAKKCAAACTNCENDCNVGHTCCLDKNGNFAGCYGSGACP